MWWGGLRGSVGLALALTIQHTMYDEGMWGLGWHREADGSLSLDCRDQPSTVVAMTVVVVALTVVVNGVTMAPLMAFLRMTDASASAPQRGQSGALTTRRINVAPWQRHIWPP